MIRCRLRTKARGREIVLVDTAGRLHTRANLMAELDKIRRVVSREVPGAPHEVLLCSTPRSARTDCAGSRIPASEWGQRHCPHRTRRHRERGSGGGVAHDLKLPIRYAGVGEGIDDFMTFDADAYVDAIFTESR